MTRTVYDVRDGKLVLLRIEDSSSPPLSLPQPEIQMDLSHVVAWGGEPPFDGDSIDEARAFVEAELSRGITCPCCGQYCKVYKRPLNGSMVFVLILIARYPRVDEWLHVPSYIAEMTADNPRRAAAVRGDWAKMKFWGLIEEEAGIRDDGSPRVGHYRITDLGRQFVVGAIAVPRYGYFYNQTLLRLSEETITIHEALGERFNYAALMEVAL